MSNGSAEEDSRLNTPPKKKIKVNTRRSQKFRISWLNEKDYSKWLAGDPNNSLKAHCTVCQKTFTAEKAVIQKHAASSSHLSRMRSTSQQTSIHKYVDQSNEPGTSGMTAVKRAEIKMCAFMVEHNLPFTVFDHMTDLLKSCYPDSEILKNVKMKSTKAKGIVKKVIAESQKSILIEKLKKTKFSILIDESTDVSAIQSLCIVVRFYDSEEGRVISRFWELIQIFQKDNNAHAATAEHIFDCVKSSFEKQGLNFDNLIGFASDGCNTMMGVHNSVASRLRDACPGISIFKCICHSIHLCASEACKQLPRTCEDLARDIYNFFKASSKRQFHFQQFQSFLDLKISKMLHPSQTRWLSLTAVVLRLVEQWDALKLFFIDQKLTAKLRTVDHIVNALNDPFIKLHFLFLEWVLPKFTDLNKFFQTDKTIIPIMNAAIESTYTELLKSYMERDYVKRTPLQDIDPSNRDKFLPPEQIYLGVKVASFLETPGVGDNVNLKNDFIKTCIQFLIVGCQQMKRRFDFNDLTLKHMNAFTPSHALSHRFRMTVPSLLPLMKTLSRVVNVSDYQAIDDEWRRLPNFELPGHVNKSDDIDVFWHELNNRSEGDEMFGSFKNLSRFVLNIISLPHSNAECERVFSAVNLTKTKVRNKLVTPTVNALLLAGQRVDNCITFEPSDKEYNQMTSRTLYSNSKKKSTSRKRTKENNLNLTFAADLESESSESEDIDNIFIPKRKEFK